LTPDLRIPGDGARRFECAHEWSALFADEDVTRDRNGIPRGTLVRRTNRYLELFGLDIAELDEDLAELF
jgi:hypothetical protein